MEWDWEFVWEHMPSLLDGLKVTLAATAFGSVLAMVLGLVLAVVLKVSNRPVRMVLELVREFIQDTPLLVQLFLVYFVVPQYTDVRLSAFQTGVIVLGVHYATYTAEVYRAGIDGVPKGQWEAARAVGLSRTRTWRSVVLPQAIPPSLPALGNYLISLFKSTPQLLPIGVLELLGSAQLVGSTYFRYIELYTVVAVLFLLLSYPSSLLVRALERRFGVVA